MIPLHRHHHFSKQLMLVGLVLSLGFLAPAFASDQDNTTRHSLILRPGADQIRVDQMGTPTGQQQPRRAVENPPTPTTTPTLHRRLTKRPAQNTTSAASATQQPLSGANLQTLPPLQQGSVANPALGTSVTPQTAMPYQTTVPFAALSSARSIAAPATAAAAGATAATPASPPSASLAQPFAAVGIGIGSSSRNGGSRSALSLFKVPAIMNLLQAPPPPLVTPPSNPTTPPPSTTPTQPPSTTPPPSTPPPSTTTTGSATLSWTLGSESDLAGYKVYVGTSSGVYTYPGSPFTIGRVNTYTITNLPAGQTYFFALSAYDNAGNNSPLSTEVSKSIF